MKLDSLGQAEHPKPHRRGVVAVAAQRTSWASHQSLDPIVSIGAAAGIVVQRGEAEFVVVVGQDRDATPEEVGRKLVQRINNAAPGIAIGMTFERCAEPHSAVLAARKAAVLAHCCPRVPTTLADCPAELALCGDPEQLMLAVGRVAAIVERPTLGATLEAYFSHDGVRRTSARALSIEPRTLDQRLRQVHSVTGLSPRRSYDSRVLVAGLTGLRLMSAAWRRSAAPPDSRLAAGGAAGHRPPRQGPDSFVHCGRHP